VRGAERAIRLSGKCHLFVWYCYRQT